jgi:signal transduction histidine kinase
MQKLLLLMTFAGLLLFGIAAVACYLLWQAEISQSWEKHTVVVLYRSSNLLSSIQDVSLFSRGYALSGDPQFKGRFAHAIEDSSRNYAELLHLVADNPRQIANLKELNAHFISLCQESKRLMSETSAASVLRQRAYLDRVRADVSRLVAEENRLLNLRSARSAFFNKLCWVLLIVQLPAGVVVVISAYTQLQKQRFENKAAFDEMKNAKGFIDLVLNSVSDAIVTVDKKGRLTFMNNSAHELYSDARVPKTVGEISSLHQYLGSDGQALASDDLPIVRALNGTEVVDSELTIVSSTNEKKYMSASAKALTDEKGQVSGAVIALRDISERKIAELQLQATRRELERAARAKDAFLASMSHELRTPLNSILGFTSILLMELPGPLNETQREQLDLVEKASDHLLSLINDILDLAKVESGKVELDLRPISLPLAVNDVLLQLESQAAVKGLKLVKPGDAHACEKDELVLADERSLRQILTNLISNAIKFTDSGSVSVELRCDEEFVYVSVIDTGPGISDDDITRLFKEFVQLDIRRKQPGTGLGLMLSQRLAQAMDGVISLESVVGKGSKFTLKLKRATR